MIRTKGEAGTGNVVEAVRHCRAVMGDIRRLCAMDEDEVFVSPRKSAPRSNSSNKRESSVVCRSSTSPLVVSPLQPTPL